MLDNRLLLRYPIESPSCLVVIGIDPGSRAGIAVFYLSYQPPFEIQSIRTTLYHVSSQFSSERINSQVNLYKKNPVRSAYQDYKALFLALTPNLVITEDVFVNKLYPAAAISLAKNIKDIENAIGQINNPHLAFIKSPPMVAKQFIAGKLTMKMAKSKDMIKEKLLEIPEIRENLTTVLQTDHEADATAIGYYAVDLIRKDPSIIYS